MSDIMTDDRQYALEGFNTAVEARVKLADMEIRQAQALVEVCAKQIACCADAVRLKMLVQAQRDQERRLHGALRERALA